MTEELKEYIDEEIGFWLNVYNKQLSKDSGKSMCDYAKGGLTSLILVKDYIKQLEEKRSELQEVR